MGKTIPQPLYMTFTIIINTEQTEGVGLPFSYPPFHYKIGGNMNEELEQELFDKYPKIFQDKDESPQVTAMCWGIECGDGWYNLIDTLCDAIQSYIDWNDKEQVIAEQVKQKYGSLRFYIRGGDMHVHGMISFAEKMSTKICEECGTMENVSQTKGWIKTICAECYNEYVSK